MKEFIVYLFKSPDCIRGWLSYIKNYNDRFTLKVLVKEINGQAAKNKAITAVNNGFNGFKILEINYTADIWGVNNFPDLKKEIDSIVKKSEG